MPELPEVEVVRRGVADHVVGRAFTQVQLSGLRVARRHLPGSVVDRPKAGFRVPLDAWFRDGLDDLARDLVSGPGAVTGTYLDRAAVTRLLDAHGAGRRDESIRIWTLASLEMWHRGLGTAPAPTARAV